MTIPKDNTHGPNPSPELARGNEVTNEATKLSGGALVEPADNLEKIWEGLEPFCRLADPGAVAALAVRSFPGLNHLAETYRLHWWSRLNPKKIRSDVELLIFRWWTTASGSPAPRRQSKSKSKSEADAPISKDWLG